MSISDRHIHKWKREKPKTDPYKSTEQYDFKAKCDLKIIQWFYTNVQKYFNRWC